MARTLALHRMYPRGLAVTDTVHDSMSSDVELGLFIMAAVACRATHHTRYSGATSSRTFPARHYSQPHLSTLGGVYIHRSASVPYYPYPAHSHHRAPDAANPAAPCCDQYHAPHAYPPPNIGHHSYIMPPYRPGSPHNHSYHTAQAQGHQAQPTQPGECFLLCMT